MELPLPSNPLGIWLFGKLPALGDFVARGLDHAERERMDHWLTAQMAEASERFGPAANDLYDQSPAWNFVDCDDAGQWAGGALCPSADRAGRRFPLIMAAPATDPAQAAGLSLACLDAIHSAFLHGWDADALAACPLAPVASAWQPDQSEWVLFDEHGPAVRLAGRFPAAIVEAMAQVAA